jgi:hypothetical protein
VLCCGGGETVGGENRKMCLYLFRVDSVLLVCVLKCGEI